jgi:hypothetical protein
METLKPKAAVHGQPQKAFSKNASDENERWRWEQEMYARKNADLDKNNHYDYSRKGLNFEIVKGEIKTLGLQEKRLHERLQDKLEELGFKGYKDGAQNMPNACVDWVFSGDHDRMCEMAFGASYKDIDYTAENDNSETIKNTDAYKFTASGYSLGAMPNIYQWALDSYKFACDKWGEDNIIGAEVHLDETTPHMHLLMVPVAERKTRGRVSTKYKKKSDPSVIIKKKEYEALSDAEKTEYVPVAKASKRLVSYSGVFGDNYGERKQYMKDFHTEYHDKVGQKYGLERGDDLDLLDPEERRKRRHMRKDQLHAVQEHDKKLAEQAERNKALEEKRDELDRSIKDKQDKATNIDKAIEESNATLANVKEELAAVKEEAEAAKEDVIVYSYEAEEALKRRNDLDVENSELEESIQSKSNHLNLLEKKIKALPTLEQLNERERRDKSLPTVEQLNERERRNNSTPTLTEIVRREQRAEKLPSLAEVARREKAVKEAKQQLARCITSISDIANKNLDFATLNKLHEIAVIPNDDKWFNAATSFINGYFKKRSEAIECSSQKLQDIKDENSSLLNINRELKTGNNTLIRERKSMYRGLILPRVNQPVQILLDEKGRKLSAVVNGICSANNVVELTDNQVNDLRTGMATKEQMGALLLSNGIIASASEKRRKELAETENRIKERQKKLDSIHLPSSEEIEAARNKITDAKKQMYQSLDIPYIEGLKLVVAGIKGQDGRGLFVVVNEKPYCGVKLTEEQLNDLNSGAATKEQMATLLMSRNLFELANKKANEQLQATRDAIGNLKKGNEWTNFLNSKAMDILGDFGKTIKDAINAIDDWTEQVRISPTEHEIMCVNATLHVIKNFGISDDPAGFLCEKAINSRRGGRWVSDVEDLVRDIYNGDEIEQNRGRGMHR